MKVIHVTVDIAIDEEMGLSVEEVLNGVDVQEHDVIDGFVITTAIKGYECTADFFLSHIKDWRKDIVEIAE